jgi:hypothetical protein
MPWKAYKLAIDSFVYWFHLRLVINRLSCAILEETAVILLRTVIRLGPEAPSE